MLSKNRLDAMPCKKIDNITYAFRPKLVISERAVELCMNQQRLSALRWFMVWPMAVKMSTTYPWMTAAWACLVA